VHAQGLSGVAKASLRLAIGPVTHARLACSLPYTWAKMPHIKPISSSFVGVLEVNLIRKERKDKAALPITNLIKEFKEHYRI